MKRWQQQSSQLIFYWRCVKPAVSSLQVKSSASVTNDDKLSQFKCMLIAVNLQQWQLRQITNLACQSRLCIRRCSLTASITPRREHSICSPVSLSRAAYRASCINDSKLAGM